MGCYQEYPRAANYEENKKYSAISVNVAFSEKEVFQADFPFVPSAPYFFPFPGEKEPQGESFTNINIEKYVSSYLRISRNN